MSLTRRRFVRLGATTLAALGARAAIDALPLAHAEETAQPKEAPPEPPAEAPVAPAPAPSGATSPDRTQATAKPTGAQPAAPAAPRELDLLINWPVLHEGMDKLGIDAILASSIEAQAYFAGVAIPAAALHRDRMAVVLVPRNGEMTFVASALDEPALERSWIEDLRLYAPHTDSPVTIAARLLSERNSGDVRGVGYEAAHLSTVRLAELAAALPDVKLAPVDDLLDRARAIKTAREIEDLRKACKVALSAMLGAAKAARAGDTERQVHERAVVAASALGATWEWLSVASGPATQDANHVSGERKLEAGDLVTLHGVIAVNGTFADLARQCVVGKPNLRQRALWRRYSEVYRNTAARMKPGAKASDIYKLSKTEYGKHGLEQALPYCGHAWSRAYPTFGEPVLSATNPRTLEKGMTLCLEQMVRVGKDAFFVEDLILVSEGGPVWLSEEWKADDLVVIG